MTNAEYITNKGWKFRDLFALFSLKEEKWNIYKEGVDKKLDSIYTPDFKDYFHACDVVLAWLDMPHYEKPILDDAEKRYLKAVIRPWRGNAKKINYIRKQEGTCTGRIIINTYYGNMEFPAFDAGTMYKGMERGREYSTEELGL